LSDAISEHEDLSEDGKILAQPVYSHTQGLERLLAAVEQLAYGANTVIA
jgi:hypothetical protein